MHKTKNIKILYILFVAISIAIGNSSCNYAKHLKKEETLLWQNRVIVKGKYNAIDKINFVNQLNAAIVQTPNTALFGLDLETFNLGYIVPRVKLWNYNWNYKRFVIKKDSTFYKNNIIQLPEIYDENKTKLTLQVLKNICINNGFYYAKVKDSIITKGLQKTSAYYIIEPGRNYLIKDVIYKVADEAIVKIINNNKSLSEIKINEPLTQTNLSSERTRLATMMIENGYYNFRQSAIEPVVDTINAKIIQNLDNPFEMVALTYDTNYTREIPKATIYFNFSDTINNQKIKKFYIGNIEVEISELGAPKSNAPYLAVPYKDIIFKNIGHHINPQILYDNIYFHPGEIFSPSQIDASINRLKSLSAFQNVRVDLKQLTDSDNKIIDSNIINCTIFITLNKSYDINYGIDGSGSTRYFLGTDISASLKNNNVFHKAYQLNTGGQFGIQTLLKTNGTKNYLDIFQVNYGLNSTLKIPHFLLPNAWQNKDSKKLPQTNIGLSFNYYQRPQTFSQLSGNGQITYAWKQNKKINWKVTPAFLNIVTTPSKDPDFLLSIKNNPIFLQQLLPYKILGSNVNFEYSTRQSAFQKHYTFYRLNVEKVGDILYIISKDENVARFTKIETELKHYINRRNKSWVNRINIYAGVPSGKSTLPYIRQQSIGGPVSLRGWRVFELGPGPVLDTSNSSSKLITNNGDIKLEINSEYRVLLLKPFGGAFRLEWAGFFDAGNIWRYRDTSNNSIAQFAFNKIPKDIAINTGMGARFDFSIFLIRLDYGVPIKQPYLTKNNGWVINNDPAIKWWRRNGTWQIGINYPF